MAELPTHLPKHVAIIMDGNGRWAKSRGLPLFVLGGGSNLLVSDHGFDGLVLRMAITVQQVGSTIRPLLAATFVTVAISVGKAVGWI